MNILKGFNLLVRFLLELCMYAAVGYWGFKTHSGWALKLMFGIGLPVLMAVLWGMFLAPKATHPLKGVLFLALELPLFAAGAIALFAAGKPTLAWVYTITLIVNKILLALWKQ